MPSQFGKAATALPAEYRSAILLKRRICYWKRLVFAKFSFENQRLVSLLLYLSECVAKVYFSISIRIQVVKLLERPIKGKIQAV
jgi:hypothetical protein